MSLFYLLADPYFLCFVPLIVAIYPDNTTLPPDYLVLVYVLKIVQRFLVVLAPSTLIYEPLPCQLFIGKLDVLHSSQSFFCIVDKEHEPDNQDKQQTF